MKIHSYYSQKNISTFDRKLFTHNKKIGNYTYSIIDKIGNGYSSTVYKGADAQTNEPVAIKVINTLNLDGELNKLLLKRQLQALKQLKHNNLLKCLDIFIGGNHTSIVTQYCETDLAYIIKKKRRIPQNQSLNYFKNIVKGFEHMRSKGYIHRDLKPANILVKKGICKIADFGFSKILVDQREVELYNVGSPLYMAPQSLKNNLYSQKSDIWSLGIILYEMIVGKAPFNADSEQNLLSEIMKKNISREQDLISDKCWKIINRCLELEDTNRINLSQLIQLLQINEKITSLNIIKETDQQLRVDRIIMNELNYVIFLRQLYNKMKDCQMLNFEVLGYLILHNIKVRVHKLSKIQHQNIYKLIEWESFTKAQTFPKYLRKIKELKQYYLLYNLDIPATTDKRFQVLLTKQLSQKQGFVISYQFYLRKYIINLKQAVQENYKSPNSVLQNQKEKQLLYLLDFMVTAYQLNAIHIEYFYNPIQFQRRSSLRKIINGKPSMSQNTLKLLQQKLRRLQF